MAMDRPSLTRATTFVTTSLEKKIFKNPKVLMIFEYFAYISIGSYPIDVMARTIGIYLQSDSDISKGL
jgi:hypothetical protein